MHKRIWKGLENRIGIRYVRRKTVQPTLVFAPPSILPSLTLSSSSQSRCAEFNERAIIRTFTSPTGRNGVKITGTGSTEFERALSAGHCPRTVITSGATRVATPSVDRQDTCARDDGWLLRVKEMGRNEIEEESSWVWKGLRFVIVRNALGPLWKFFFFFEIWIDRNKRILTRLEIWSF